MRSRQKCLCIAVMGLVSCVASTLAADADDATESQDFQKVISYHVQRYPLLEIRDLYKLVFQAAMGSEHAAPDREAAKQWLDRELSTLSAAQKEPLSVPLSPSGALVRVNLRVFIERGGNVVDLLDAFVATARQFAGSEENLRRYWSYVEAMAEAGAIPFERAQLRQLFSEMEARGLPAVHHSNTYRDHYQPAYRVVLVELLEPDVRVHRGW